MLRTVRGQTKEDVSATGARNMKVTKRQRSPDAEGMLTMGIALSPDKRALMVGRGEKRY